MMKRTKRTAAILFCLMLLASSAASLEPYAHTNSRGATYYLFHKEVQLKNSDRTRTIYYFSKDPKNPKGEPLAAVPADRQVSETKNGLPVLKKRSTE